MKGDVLIKVEGAIPQNVKDDLRKRVASGWYRLGELSNQLKQMVNNYEEIRLVLFNNNENKLYYSGDILARVMFDHWTTGNSLEELFDARAQETYQYSNIE